MKIFISLLFFSLLGFSQNAQDMCTQLTGDGSGKDGKARTSLMKLTHTAAKSDGKSRLQHEAIILNALKGSSSFEVSTFLIQQLDICGAKASLPLLGVLLNHPELGANAARTFTNLAKYDPSLARETILNAYKKQNSPYLLNAISILKLQDSTALAYYRQALTDKSKLAFALQGLAQAGNEKDSKSLLSAFVKADKAFRGRAFRLNLVFTESLAGKNKNAANSHLASLKAALAKNEIPFITGIASVDFKLNGVSDAWLDSLPSENIHTQIGILRLLKASNYSGLATKLESRAQAKPNDTIYMEALAAVDSKKAAPIVLNALNSKNAATRAVAAKLATNYGGKFATSLLSSLIQKGEAGKEDTAMAKSMVSSKNINEVTALWNNLNPSLTLAFIEVTGNIKNKTVAAKMIQATQNSDKKVQRAALKALKEVVSAENLNTLKSMLDKEKSSTAVRYLQTAAAASIAQADEAVVKQMFSSLFNNRNDKLLVAFAKSNRKEVLPLLKRDLQSDNANIQKETIKTLSAMSPELSSELLCAAVEKAKDERNKILAARALAEAATNSKESPAKRKAYLQKALKQKLPANETKLLNERLKKVK